MSLCAYVPFVCVCVGVCNSFCTAELGDEVLRGGSVRTPLTPGCHCAPVMINHVVQRLALFGREGTNHTPHYPGLVTLKHCSPRTPQPVAVWMERRRRRAQCVWRGAREHFILFFWQEQNMGGMLMTTETEKEMQKKWGLTYLSYSDPDHSLPVLKSKMWNFLDDNQNRIGTRWWPKKLLLHIINPTCQWL